ncbi:MAG: segregation/condensation protein A [Spirochaetales bacterium]|jgi:segregation and condensation protein A|nr:segregation/condensation protein A [Spirochaetales bacterium]
MEDVRSEKSTFKFKIEGVFEGPLDLLLNLIKINEKNIYDIPITEITEQYLAYLELAVRIDLENITDFYLMAATLLYIKSRMLLPVEMDLSEEFEDPRKELVDRLIEYQKIKKLSDMIGEKEREAEWIFERGNRQGALPFAEEDLWEEIEVWDLLKTFSALIGSLSSEKILDLYEEVSVNEKLTLIQERLDAGKEFFLTDLITRRDSFFDVICSFLAILEAVKMKMIRIYQNKLFGDIRIAGVENPPDTEGPPEEEEPLGAEGSRGMDGPRGVENAQEEDSGNTDGAD